MKLKYILTLIFSISIGTAHAGNVEIHLQAAHYDLIKGGITKDLNDQTPGIGYDTGGYIFGVYHNSYHRTTAYAAKKIKIRNDFGYEIGFATGYELPFLITIYKQYGRVKLRVMPGSVIAFGLSISL